MKAIRNLTIRLCLMLTGCLAFYSPAVYGNQCETSLSYYSIDLNITINETTSDDELDDIIKMLSENGIDCKFSNIDRNENAILMGISINISDTTGQQLSTTIRNNLGIGEFTFGRRDGQLFIDQNGLGHGNFAFFNMPNVQSFGFERDSLLQNYFKGFSFNFNDFFNDDGSAKFGAIDSMSLDKIFSKMQSRLGSSTPSQGQKYFNFVDDPNTEKLIIIDGAESNFITLNQLAKENKIDAVDYLKSKTAISLYGDKAKDGAIIVITKQ